MTVQQTPLSTSQSIVRNLAALALFWIVSFVIIQSGIRLFPGWLAPSVGEILGSAAGILIALRMRARVAAYLLTAAAAMSSAGLAIHALYGIHVGQGFPFYAALAVAASLAVAGTLLVASRAGVALTQE